MHRLPDFLGIGTQKGGTTTLHKLLQRHPEIYLPNCKEIHYFDQHYTSSTSSWYSSYFKEAKEEQKAGEITPIYMYLPEIPERIYKLLPNIKILILLRDPVERTLSHIFHAKKRGFENLTPQQAIEKEESRLKTRKMYNLQKHSYVSRSMYAEQLDRYEKIFKEEQMLVLKSEQLFEETKETLRRITSFLNVKSIELAGEIPQENRGDQNAKNIDSQLREKLQTTFAETNRLIKRRYGIEWKW